MNNSATATLIIKIFSGLSVSAIDLVIPATLAILMFLVAFAAVRSRAR